MHFTPSTSAETLDAVRWAVAEEQPVEVVGSGSKKGIGRPIQTEHTLDLSKLTGVTLYEPEELVLSARAGTPLAEIDTLLAERGQELAFEPMDYSRLLDLETGEGKAGTIGGVLAANLSGPRRLKAGAARDHILGINAVSGRGEAFKSGGRVVKNVTGYDLSKAMAGSWGTLAVVTDLTFKVLPRAEMETTVLLRGLDDERAVAAMALALGSSAEVSAAAHLPMLMSDGVAGAVGPDAATVLRVEGFGPSVVYRVNMLRDLFGGHVSTVEDVASRALWADIRDVAPFADGTRRPVWRVSMAPSQGWRLVAELRMHVAVSAFYDWQGGLVWLRMEHEPEAAALRAMIRHFGGGHATLVRATPSVRASTEVFEPAQPGLAALAQRLKSEFDPRGILNPGRMG
ncbi:MAG: glycolate oxidase subunit GlcE [Mesorhizobium sp.]